MCMQGHYYTTTGQMHGVDAGCCWSACYECDVWALTAGTHTHKCRTLAHPPICSQVCIDLFLLGQAYADVATLSVLSNTTGGSLHSYAPFSPAQDQDQLLNDLKWNISRPQVIVAKCRGAGMGPHLHHVHTRVFMVVTRRRCPPPPSSTIAVAPPPLPPPSPGSLGHPCPLSPSPNPRD